MEVVAAVLAVVAFAVMLVLIGLGIGLGLVASLLSAALIGLWLLISSLAIGLWAKRVQTGLRALIYQLGALVGAPVCAFALWFVLHVCAGFPNALPILLLGGLGGALAGLGMAFGVDLISRRVAEKAGAGWRKIRVEIRERRQRIIESSPWLSSSME